MLSYLSLLGAYLLFIIMVAAFVAALVYLDNKWRFREFLNLDITVSSAPLHIQLNEEIEPDWVNKKPVKAFVAELEKLGYQRGKSYSINEIDGFSLLVFYKAPLVAVLYNRSVAGNQVDIGVDEIDGNGYIFSNVSGGHIETRPEVITEYLPQASIAEIHTKAERLVNSIGNNFVDINANNFKEYFESDCKKDREFAVRKGGVSFEEFVAVVNDSTFNFKDKISNEWFTQYRKGELDQWHKDKISKKWFTQYKKGELDRWHKAALEEYRVSENIDKDKFDIGPKLFIIPFKSHSPAFVQYLAGQRFITNKQKKQLMKVAEKVDDVNLLFDRINEMLSPDLRPDFVKDIDYPLPIRLFKMSQKMMDRGKRKGVKSLLDTISIRPKNKLPLSQSKITPTPLCKEGHIGSSATLACAPASEKSGVCPLFRNSLIEPNIGDLEICISMVESLRNMLNRLNRKI